MTRPLFPWFARPGRALLSAAVTAVFALLPVGSYAAYAADSNLQLSSDGMNYSRSLASPVFGSITDYIPGSNSSADIWVRNDAGDSGFLSIATLVNEADAEMAANLGLVIESNLGSTVRTPLPGTGYCSDLAVGWPIAAGETAKLTLVLDMDTRATNAVRRQYAGFALRFLMEDQDGSTRRGACASNDGGTVIPGVPDTAPSRLIDNQGSLADTGTPDPLGWLTGALAAIAAGVGIIVFMRRKKAVPNE